jgi:hypothetical protein
VQMGNAELSRLWNLSSDNHEVLVNSARAPSLDEYLKPLDDRPTLLKDDKVRKGSELIFHTLSQLLEFRNNWRVHVLVIYLFYFYFYFFVCRFMLGKV